MQLTYTKLLDLLNKEKAIVIGLNAEVDRLHNLLDDRDETIITLSKKVVSLNAELSLLKQTGLN